MSDPAALTVALVGGQFHLGSGAVLDTRQRIGTDGEDLILRDVLSSSPHWWRAAKDFAEAVMTDTGDPKAWAFVYAGRTLRTYKPDAPPKRTRLSTVLDGAPQLRDPKKFGGEGSTIEADRSNKKFKILDAPLRIPDLRYSVPPTVVISTLPSQSYMASTIQEELQWILGHWPSSVFVLPHTRGIQEHLVEMDWFDRSAVSDQLASEMVAHETIPSSDPWIESLIEADPTTTQADLQITGFIDHGKWASAADLQAAWEFVEVRYDLQIGLWDLARDPALRRTLLDPEPAVAPDAEEVAVPDLMQSKADSEADKRESAEADEDAARLRLAGGLLPELLKYDDWEQGWRGAGAHYILPATHKKFDGDLFGTGWSSIPLVWYEIEIFKWQVKLILQGVMPGVQKVLGFLNDHHDEIERITGSRPEPNTFLIERYKDQGWANELDDWTVTAERIHRALSATQPSITTLVTEVEPLAAEFLRNWRPNPSVEPSESGSQPEKKAGFGSLLRRLLP